MNRSLFPRPLLLLLALVVVVMGGSVAQAAEDEIVARSASPLSDPVFAPDGGKLAWVDGGRLMIRESAAGTAPKVAADGLGELRSPCFSGDGKTVFFCARKDANFDIQRLDLETGKIKALTATPEDEFAVVCTRDRFTREYEPVATATYFKLLFLRGPAKEGVGTLCESRDDGSEPVVCEGITAQSVSIGKEAGWLLLSAKPGIHLAEWVPSYDARMLMVEGPGQPVPATGGADLTEAVFAADGRHYFARRGGETVIGVLGSTTVRPFVSEAVSRIGVDPSGRHLAYARKKGNEFEIVQTSVPTEDLKIVNGHKWLPGLPGNRTDRCRLSPEAFGKLVQQRFVVTPDAIQQFGFVYENNRYNWSESYISADAVLFLFHLFYDSTLKTIERGAFREGMFEIAQAMAETARKASVAARDAKAKELYLRWWGFFSLAGALREDSQEAVFGLVKKLPPVIRAAALEDAGRIFAAGESEASAILGRKVDFTHFKVRGHYEGNPALSTYFRLMMWFSQVPLNVFEPDSDKPSDDLPMILSLFHLGREARVKGKPVLDRLAELNRPLEYLIGETEDIGVVSLNTLLAGKVELAKPDAVVAEAQIKSAFSALSAWPKPKIRPQNGVQVMFFPQRFTLDSYALQRLVYKAIGTPDNMRLIPNMLDVFAAMGSERAEKLLLEVLDQGRYKNYRETLAALKKEIAGFAPEYWNADLYRGWLKVLQELTAPVAASAVSGLPPFARSEAWMDRLLNTALGSLTTLKHDTLLYSKQGAAEAGEGGEEYLIREYPDTLVEPYPEVFARLRRMTLELYTLMSAQGFLPAKERETDGPNSYDDIMSLTAKGVTLRMIDLFKLLEEASQKQRENKPLTSQEKTSLFEFGRVLEHLTLVLMADGGEVGNINNEEIPLVADTFTGEGTCLEMAIGRVFNLWVRHDAGAGEKIFRGGVFSYYEFEQPVGERLSDKEWRKRIRENKLPKQPSWMSSFIVGDPVTIKADEEYHPEEPSADN